MSRLGPNDWRYWAMFYVVINALEALSDRVSEAGEISSEDVELLADNVGYLKELKPEKD